MRRLLALVLGGMALAGGILIHRPDREGRLRQLQIGLNELSWLPASLGLLAVLLAILGSPWLWLPLLLGGAGTLLSLKPFIDHRAAAEDMASAMRMGLGRDYESRIPSAVRLRLLDTVWSLPNALGARERSTRVGIWRDLEYACPDGHPLLLDVYEPSLPPLVGDRYAAVIVLHPGGWREGDRGGWFEASNRLLAQQGYKVFDVQYRLSNRVKWPAQLHDVQSAIRWVKAHADQYRIDPNRVALLGRSAGGHLALMAAMRAEADTQVQAVVSIYGPLNMKWPDLEPDSAIIDLVGGRYPEKADAYTDANPLDWVRDDLPPLLLVEAMQDTLVPYVHGDLMLKRLLATNTRYVFLRVPWARHGFDALSFGLGAQLIQYHLDRFLAWSFYREG